jgi:hypothetical protein
MCSLRRAGQGREGGANALQPGVGARGGFTRSSTRLYRGPGRRGLPHSATAGIYAPLVGLYPKPSPPPKDRPERGARPLAEPELLRSQNGDGSRLQRAPPGQTLGVAERPGINLSRTDDGGQAFSSANRPAGCKDPRAGRIGSRGFKLLTVVRFTLRWRHAEVRPASLPVTISARPRFRGAPGPGPSAAASNLAAGSPCRNELGLDHYEGRGWRGFHHHGVLCMAAYCFLAAERGRLSPPQAVAFLKPAPIPKGFTPRGAARASRKA